MKYLGSKNRLAKEIITTILNTTKLTNFTYIEPFVGGANIIDKFPANRKIGADINKPLITLLSYLQNGWQPPNNLTEEEYKQACYINDEDNPITAFAGFCCSFAGKYFGGYARGKTTEGKRRNYASESRRNLLKQSPNLKEITFICSDYRLVDIPLNSLIYCDPPYKDTTEYSNSLNYEEFYSWCREQKANGNEVYISEYNMPPDFICIWEKEFKVNLNENKALKRVERLFTL
ncbi:MAG: DNA adenine methylase [Bacteroidales bacterium]|jgi:DNA adenine methylase